VGGYSATIGTRPLISTPSRLPRPRRRPLQYFHDLHGGLNLFIADNGRGLHDYLNRNNLTPRQRVLSNIVNTDTRYWMVMDVATGRAAI